MKKGGKIPTSMYNLGLGSTGSFESVKQHVPRDLGVIGRELQAEVPLRLNWQFTLEVRILSPPMNEDTQTTSPPEAEPSGALESLLESIPTEIGQQILLHISIGPDLLALGLASKSLFPLVFGCTVPFARLHFKRQLAISNVDMWNYLESAGIKNEGFLALPFAYQTAIYGQVLEAKEWAQLRTTQFNDDKSNHLMRSLRWNLSGPRTLRLVQELMAGGFDIACQQHRALQWAMRSKYKHLVDFLLSVMLENPIEDDGHVFTHAALFGQVEIVEWLLTTGLDPSVDGNRALRAAAAKGQLGVANLLLGDPRVNPADADNRAICEASRYGRVEMVERLLQDARVDPADVDNLAIHLASEHGHVGVVERLLQDARVDPSGGDNSPIRVASQKGHVGVVEKLLQDARVDPEAHNNYSIQVACANGYWEIVKLLLLDSRVDPAVRVDTLVWLACYFAQLWAVELLLADARVSGATGANKCIHAAAQENCVDVLKLLLQDERTDPSYLSNLAIQAAAGKGHIEALELLLADSRVDPAAADNSPIRHASRHGHIHIVERLLMDPRVDPSAGNNKALRLANVNGHSNVAQLLESDARVARLLVARKVLHPVTEKTRKPYAISRWIFHTFYKSKST
ncbi:hypothetical protein HDU98_009663 [Podochytrium sp. JEL0797]|nr:hypothetical protein HDU98_009663 [Podochytrium sp. JEL0797]